jgi:hypothetical protein
MRSKAHTAQTARLVWSYIVQINECQMKKFGINCHLRNKLFLIVIHRFSLVNAAMNAPRICKLPNGVNKTSQFLLFSAAKGGIKTIAHTVNCGMKKKDLIQVRNE